MPPPRKRRVALSPWTDLDIQTSWSVSSVRAALRQHEEGYFQQSGKLIESLARDIRLGHGKAGVIGTRANALLGSPFRLKPADEDNPRAVQIAEEMEAHWWTAMPEANLRELLRFYWLGGGGPGQLKWQKPPELGRWLPIVEPWQLQSFYHEEQTVEDGDLRRRLMALTRQGTVEVTPGDGIWLLLADGPRWWLNASVRSVAIPWLGVQYTARDWWRHSERLGHPIIKAMYPAEDLDENIDGWLADLKALATETTATLPQGVGAQDVSYDLQLLEAAQESPESFERLLQHTYVNYAIHFLGHNLSAEVREGQAVTGDASEVRTDYKKADNETLSTQLRAQLVVPWAAEWYPDGVELAPWPWWDVEPAEDTKQKAETQKLAAETLEILAKTGHEPEDLNAWAEPYDLRLRKMPEPEPPTEPPPDEDDEEPPAGDDDGEGPPEDEDELLATMLAELQDQQDTFAGGLAYADELVAAGVHHARAAMAPAIRAALDAVDGAETPDEAREALLGAFRGMDPEKLAGWLERAMVLAELKGQETVLGEL